MQYSLILNPKTAIGNLSSHISSMMIVFRFMSPQLKIQDFGMENSYKEAPTKHRREV
jgi:hypothetical protein